MRNMKKHYPMKSDVREKDDRYIVDIDLPGFSKDAIKAYISDGYLVVSAFRDQEKEKKTGKTIYRERYSGSCQRSFYVGDSVRQEDIRAVYRHGVLKLTIPKHPTQKAIAESSIEIS